MVRAGKQIRPRRNGLAILFVVGVVLWQTTSLSAQDTIMAPPTVRVFAPANDSDRSQYDTLSLTMADTIAFTLRLLGDYRVQTPPEATDTDIDSTISVEDPAVAASYAGENELDYLVVGNLGTTDDGEIAFEIAVWDHAVGEFTIRERAVAESLFDTFDVAEELTLRIVSAMSGREIAFGTVELEVPGGAGAYLVFVDGQYAGFGRDRLENVPAGERQIAVLPLTSNGSSREQQTTTLSLEPDSVASIQFELPRTENPWFAPELIAHDGGGVERDTADAAPEVEIPDWFPPHFADGTNPDTWFFQNTTVADVLGDRWFHTPARWQSLAGRFPLVEWDIDGRLDEWPRSVPYYPFDPRSDGDALVRVLEYQVAYGPDEIYLSLLLGGSWSQFLAGPEPHIFLKTTLVGPGPPARWNFAVKRQNDRWRIEARENRNPYEDFPFQPLRGVEIGQAEA
ncbi:MAG: hypothetical protein ACLFSV_12755, partial [Alkalispirochaeta sp.]